MSRDSGVGGFSVVPAELRNSAGAMRNLADGFAKQSTLKYWLDAAEVGDEDLACALAEFQNNSADTIRNLRADTAELAQRLHDTAGSYEKTDSESARILSDEFDQR